jgi:diguanylate cyclase (GGDEF)-like protein
VLDNFSYLLFCCILVLLGIIVFLILNCVKLKKLSEIDFETGLLNFKTLKSLVEKKTQQHETFTIVLIDLDKFKTFNTMGFLVGDFAIKEFAKFLKDNLPKDIIISRFRIGDEFALIFPKASQYEVEQKMEKLEEKCATLSFHFIENYNTNPLHFSYGVVESNDNSKLEDLFLEAEKRLNYQKSIKLNG